MSNNAEASAKISTTMARAQLKIEKRSLLIAIAFFGLIALGAPQTASAQSCALCYTQAASAGARLIEALRSGILILIVPPTVMSVCMIFIVRKKSNRFRRDNDAPDSAQEW